jgi:hypothetical protein
MGFQRFLAKCRFNARRLEVSQKFHRHIYIGPKKRFTGFKQILFGNFGSQQDPLLSSITSDNKKYFMLEIYHNDLTKHKQQLFWGIVYKFQKAQNIGSISLTDEIVVPILRRIRSNVLSFNLDLETNTISKAIFSLQVGEQESIF